MLRFLVAFALLAVGCKNPPREQSQLGPFSAEHFAEVDAQGQLLHCYLLSKDSNQPVRICGDGGPAPDRKTYLIEAKAPKPGKFTDEVGEPLGRGWYLLREASASKVEAWSLGQLGEHLWIGRGSVLVAVDTTGKTTHVRLITPLERKDIRFDVPLAPARGYAMVTAPEDAALLLVPRIGLGLAILVHAPLSNPDVETLDLALASSPGAEKLRKRGREAELLKQVFRVDATTLSNISWKGEDPYFEGARLGPFRPLPSDE